MILRKSLAAAFSLALASVAVGAAPQGADPLMDWSDWQNYRSSVHHPSLTIKRPDLERAKENAKRYAWAREYVEKIKTAADAALGRIGNDDAFVTRMIEVTTPQDPIFTPCPACRDQHK